jgi:hypothetical protein
MVAIGPLAFAAASRCLGCDQVLQPIGERPGILLRKLLSHSFDGWFHARPYRDFARFRLGLFHQFNFERSTPALCQ